MRQNTIFPFENLEALRMAVLDKETRKGEITEDNFETLIQLVLDENPDAMKDIMPKNIDWIKVASDMGRSRDAVYNFYMTQVHTYRMFICDYLTCLFRFTPQYEDILLAHSITM